MEFGTGHDVRPGDDITLETSAGAQDLGQATYDSDHDGVGDSVIVIEGDHEYLITDADHDGTADSVRAFDASGHEVDPSSGDRIDGPPGSPDQGSNIQSGNNVQGSNVQLGADAALGGAAAQDGMFGAASVGSGPSGTGMLVPGDDGTPLDLGAVTVDLDRDGTADTAVVREADGAVIGYTDRDGDGIADQMTRIDVNGGVVISVTDGAGGWEVAATGHLDSSGALVEDPAVLPA